MACSSLRCSLTAFARYLFLITAIAVLTSVAANAAGQRDAASIAEESRVKAAYLYRFISYIDWPPQAFPQPNSPYVIGIVGEERVAEEFSRISVGKLVNSRPISVKKIFYADSLSGVHLLYIGHEENSRLSQWMKASAGLPLLTVTESRDAIGLGSMINFRLVDDYVRFEVGLDSFEKSGLHISSRMLAVAHSVFRGTAR